MLGVEDGGTLISRIFLALGYIGLGLLQVLPILLWFEFHGAGISDGTPPSAFVAHWAYSIPHITLIGVSIAVLFTIMHRHSQPIP